MSQAVIAQQAIPVSEREQRETGLFDQYDPWLLAAVLSMMSIGLVMVASASITVADSNFGEPFHYLWRQMIAAGIGLSLGFVAMHTPQDQLRQASSLFLFLAVFMLVLVLMLN